jgi:hypothetical protein
MIRELVNFDISLFLKENKNNIGILIGSTIISTIIYSAIQSNIEFQKEEDSKKYYENNISKIKSNDLKILSELGKEKTKEKTIISKLNNTIYFSNNNEKPNKNIINTEYLNLKNSLINNDEIKINEYNDSNIINLIKIIESNKIEEKK